MGSFVSQLVPCFVLTLIQLVAALPWTWALFSRSLKTQFRQASNWGVLVGGVALVTLVGAFFLGFQRGSSSLELYGRFYASILHFQLVVDAFVAFFGLLTLVWPKGGAVALAAFREGIRQPMFWIIAMGAGVILLVGMVVPYFTFGDDFKLYKQICFDAAMAGALLFGVLAASMSIHDEIEGKTAVTLMSKPVTRRQFLLGKYLGILLAAWALTQLIGWSSNWFMMAQPRWNPLDEVSDPMVEQAQQSIGFHLTKLGSGDMFVFLRGVSMWSGDALANTLGLALSFGKVMVLLAIAATLATRLPMVANILITMVVFLFGHLAPVLTRVTVELKRDNPNNVALNMIGFLTKLFETLLPSLDSFSMGPAIIRDTPIDMIDFAYYTGSVLVYALMYTSIALLFGLILFEDRDLA
ncbi:MAG TPA: ABC transporter permease subunit [Gemmataceae bacterium]|jgi:ABC-type transport system involved in multi-copper enzyme maturation permease subunit|nr:ABC transporter permease subunit [Gemmataceae bacterium]